MKKESLVFLFFMACINLVQAQATGPQMTFEKKTHNFGDIQEGVIVKYSFTYTNTGTDTLIVSRVITSSGNVVPEAYTRIIPPGQNGIITIAYMTEGRVGKFSKVITVIHNMNTSDSMVLFITGNVLPKP